MISCMSLPHIFFILSLHSSWSTSVKLSLSFPGCVSSLLSFCFHGNLFILPEFHCLFCVTCAHMNVICLWCGLWIGIISEFILWFLWKKVRCSDVWHETSFRKYSCFASMTKNNCMCPVHCSSDQDTAASSCSRWKQVQRPTAGQCAQSERP